jgi:hypothetical protein
VAAAWPTGDVDVGHGLAVEDDGVRSGAEEIGSLKPEPENDLIACGSATFDQRSHDWEVLPCPTRAGTPRIRNCGRFASSLGVGRIREPPLEDSREAERDGDQSRAGEPLDAD